MGKVKTRLAVGVGPKMALKLYTFLLKHTLKIAKKINVKRTIFYTEETDDIRDGFSSAVQVGAQLGDRMVNSLKQVAEPAVIIGTDCYDLTSELLNQAFSALEKHQVVIGPAEDGGYYLIGMKEPYAPLFEGKKWSTESVFIDTIEDIKRLGLNHYILPTLSDIDNIDDLKRSELNKIYEQYLSRND